MRRATELGHSTAWAARRWQWCAAAAVAGAAAGGAVAWGVRRWQGSDAPDAVEPEQLRAVVDRPADQEQPPA